MKRAFTLIELLVVITIIVVLLALLTPALDKAIYQAELVQCAAQLDAIASGAVVYAMDQRRRYPYRTTDEQEGVNGSPVILKNFLGAEATAQQGDSTSRLDERPVIDGYIDLNLLVDPMCEPVDLSEEASSPETGVYASYNLFYGWSYLGHSGMDRIGDRFSWTSNTAQGPVKHQFNYLASDLELMTAYDAPAAVASHPDKLGSMTTMRLQDEDVTDLGSQPTGNFSLVGNAIKLTISTWILKDSRLRGPLDLNFAGSDGSVIRINDVAWDESLEDGRVVHVPYYKPGGGYPDEHMKIAKP